MFPSESGETPLDPKNYLHRTFYRAMTKARIADFRWHDLRHTFASRLVMAGVDVRIVQDLMGHQVPRHDDAATRTCRRATGSTRFSA